MMKGLGASTKDLTCNDTILTLKTNIIFRLSTDVIPFSKFVKFQHSLGKSILKTILNQVKIRSITSETLSNLCFSIALINKASPAFLSTFTPSKFLPRLKILQKSPNDQISTSVCILISTLFPQVKSREDLAFKKFSKILVHKCTSSLASSQLKNFVAGLVILDNITQ